MLAFHNSHSTSKVDELLSKSVLVKKKENHDMLIYVIEGIRLLGRQGIAMRGSHMETGDSTSEPNSNMWQVLRAFGCKSELLSSLLEKSQTYCSAGVQNELLEIMSSSVMRTIVNDIRQADWYALMIDEIVDITGKLLFVSGIVLNFPFKFA